MTRLCLGQLMRVLSEKGNPRLPPARLELLKLEKALAALFALPTLVNALVAPKAPALKGMPGALAWMILEKTLCTCSLLEPPTLEKALAVPVLIALPALSEELARGAWELLAVPAPENELDAAVLFALATLEKACIAPALFMTFTLAKELTPPEWLMLLLLLPDTLAWLLSCTSLRCAEADGVAAYCGEGTMTCCWV